MRLRPLNNTVILEQDLSLVPIDSSVEATRIASEGYIILPEYNTMMKVPDEGLIVSCGSKCHYNFKVGQRVKIKGVNSEEPMFVTIDNVKYRITTEESVLLVWEND